MIRHRGAERIRCFPPPPPLPPQESGGGGDGWDDEDKERKESQADWVDFTIGFLGYFTVGSLLVTLLLSTLASLQLFLEILFRNKE